MIDCTHLFCRRTVLHGLATGGGLVATAGVAGCGGSDGEGSAGTASSGSAGGGVLGRTADIAVGGGTIYADQQVVVTQPTEGEFRAFTSICTHQQCPVTSVEDGEIICSCHDSHYSITDGSVVSGPAPEALAEKPVQVKGGEVVLA